MSLTLTGQIVTHRVQKTAAALAGALVMVTTGLVGTVAAAPAIDCGTVITKTTTLTADVGPCPGAGPSLRPTTSPSTSTGTGSRATPAPAAPGPTRPVWSCARCTG